MTPRKTIILPGTDEGIDTAAQALRAGELVAIPTETVYGLAADARNERAVREIFRVKGRPSNNPLIVHVATTDQCRALSAVWPPLAEKLAATHWPGPLTLVVESGSSIATTVRAGGMTVGLRIPDHPVALRLLQRCGLPLAAPSANLSNRISPTSAEAVLEQLDGRIPYILDGGPCSVGIESTVVDTTASELRLLRPGMIFPDASALSTSIPAEPTTGIQRSPGMLPRHYAPTIPLILVDKEMDAPEGAFLIGFQGEGSSPCFGIRLPTDPAGYAASIYSALRKGEQSGAEVIALVKPPDMTTWAAIWDRLRRAATP